MVCISEMGSPASGDSSWDGAVSYYDGSCSGDGFACGTAKSSLDASGQRCLAQTGYSVDSVASVADADNHDLFGVLVENSGSLSGRVPEDHRGWHYDDDGDGTADVSVFSRYDGSPDRATDPEGRSHSALRSLVETWRTVRAAAGERREVQFGLWTFRGEPDPSSTVDGATGGAKMWTSDSEEAMSAIDVAQSAEPSGRGNVLESITNVLNDEGETPFAGDEYEGADKTLVVFTDGPSEVPPGWKPNATVDAAVEAANAAGVRLFVVHLDPAVAMGEPKQVLDDPAYATLTGNCSSDADCSSHETCREVRGYSSSGEGEVNEGGQGTSCMPRRRPDGRTGPLEIYSRLACATGGGYQYVKSADQLTAAMSWLPHTAGSLWEADVSVEALGAGNYTSGDANRLQATIEATVGGTTESVEMSQTDGDNRGVIFTE